MGGLQMPTNDTFDICGINHLALVCQDMDRTVGFYSGVLGMPLTKTITLPNGMGQHFFFDIGNGNCLAFFDMPGLGLSGYQEVLGGHHHLAISMTPNEWDAARDRLEAAGVEVAHVDGSSLYFVGPDGERLELISDPLGEMYGSQVL